MFDRKTIRQHHDALNAIMKKYCEEHGLVFVPKSLSYSNTSFDYKFEAKEKAENGYAELSELDRMVILGHIAAAPEEVKNSDTVIGHSVYALNGRVLKLVGFNRKAKYCWTVEVNGQLKRCANDAINWARGFAA
jgi:hypothetical protein